MVVRTIRREDLDRLSRNFVELQGMSLQQRADAIDMLWREDMTFMFWLNGVELKVEDDPKANIIKITPATLSWIFITFCSVRMTRANHRRLFELLCVYHKGLIQNHCPPQVSESECARILTLMLKSGVSVTVVGRLWASIQTWYQTTDLQMKTQLLCAAAEGGYFARFKEMYQPEIAQSHIQQHNGEFFYAILNLCLPSQAGSRDNSYLEEIFQLLPLDMLNELKQRVADNLSGFKARARQYRLDLVQRIIWRVERVVSERQLSLRDSGGGGVATFEPSAPPSPAGEPTQVGEGDGDNDREEVATFESSVPPSLAGEPAQVSEGGVDGDLFALMQAPGFAGVLWGYGQPAEFTFEQQPGSPLLFFRPATAFSSDCADECPVPPGKRVH